MSKPLPKIVQRLSDTTLDVSVLVPGVDGKSPAKRCHGVVRNVTGVDPALQRGKDPDQRCQVSRICSANSVHLLMLRRGRAKPRAVVNSIHGAIPADSQRTEGT